jgi:regulator of replication initiation timing
MSAVYSDPVKDLFNDLADRIAAKNAEIAALRIENKNLRGALDEELRKSDDKDEAAEAMRAKCEEICRENARRAGQELGLMREMAICNMLADAIAALKTS